MNLRLETSLHYSPYGGRYEFRVFNRASRAFAKPIAFETDIDEGAYIEPTISFSQEEVQAMFDELCRAGFKPSRQENAVAALDATKEHLSDMREIAFSALRNLGVESKGVAK